MIGRSGAGARRGHGGPGVNGEHCVHVVDDEAEARDALCFLLRGAGLHVRTHASGADFLAAPLPDVPTCVVLDIRMPGIGGLEVLERLRGGGAAWPVIMFTAFADVPTTVRAFKAGAVDLMEKPYDGATLVRSIQDALRADAGRRMGASERRAVLDRVRALTARERQVMALLVQGAPNKIVAVELGISIKTVEIHRSRVMRKMAAGSLAELVRMALLAGEEGIRAVEAAPG